MTNIVERFLVWYDNTKKDLLLRRGNTGSNLLLRIESLERPQDVLGCKILVSKMRSYLPEDDDTRMSIPWARKLSRNIKKWESALRTIEGEVSSESAVDYLLEGVNIEDVL